MTTVPLQLLGVTTMCGALSWKLPTLDLYRVWVHQGKVLTSSPWRGGFPLVTRAPLIPCSISIFHWSSWKLFAVEFFSQASARALCKVLVCPWLGRLVEATWTKVIKEPREAMEMKESWIIETSPALRNTISAPPKTLKFPLGIHVKVRGMMQIPKACGAACSDAIILACGWRCEFNRSLGEITGVFQGCFLGRTVAYRGHGWQALLKHVETLNRLIDLL